MRIAHLRHEFLVLVHKRSELFVVVGSPGFVLHNTRFEELLALLQTKDLAPEVVYSFFVSLDFCSAPKQTFNHSISIFELDVACLLISQMVAALNARQRLLATYAGCWLNTRGCCRGENDMHSSSRCECGVGHGGQPLMR